MQSNGKKRARNGCVANETANETVIETAISRSNTCDAANSAGVPFKDAVAKANKWVNKHPVFTQNGQPYNYRAFFYIRVDIRVDTPVEDRVFTVLAELEPPLVHITRPSGIMATYHLAEFKKSYQKILDPSRAKLLWDKELQIYVSRHPKFKAYWANRLQEITEKFGVDAADITSRELVTDQGHEYESFNGARFGQQGTQAFRLTAKDIDTDEEKMFTFCVPDALIPNKSSCYPTKTRDEVMTELTRLNELDIKKKTEYHERFREALQEKVGMLLTKRTFESREPTDPEAQAFEKLCTQMLKAGFLYTEVNEARTAFYKSGDSGKSTDTMSVIVGMVKRLVDRNFKPAPKDLDTFIDLWLLILNDQTSTTYNLFKAVTTAACKNTPGLKVVRHGGYKPKLQLARLLSDGIYVAMCKVEEDLVGVAKKESDTPPGNAAATTRIKGGALSAIDDARAKVDKLAKGGDQITAGETATIFRELADRLMPSELERVKGKLDTLPVDDFIKFERGCSQDLEELASRFETTLDTIKTLRTDWWAFSDADSVATEPETEEEDDGEEEEEEEEEEEDEEEEDRPMEIYELTKEDLRVGGRYFKMARTALKAMGGFIAEKLTAIVHKKVSSKQSRQHWEQLIELGFEPITKEGRNCFSFTQWVEPDAMRCVSVKEFVLTRNSSKFIQNFPIDNRDFLEACMVHGATIADAELERTKKFHDERIKEALIQEIVAQTSCLALENEERERKESEAYKKSDVYKQEQRVRNQKAKAKAKEAAAAKKLEAERREKERTEKVKADALAKQQADADECIDNGIKYGQQLWDKGMRKEARERLGLANKKHSTSASAGARERAKATRDTWSEIERNERDAERANTPPSLATLIAIGDDTPDVLPAPSPPRESQSQRKARRKREKAEAERLAKEAAALAERLAQEALLAREKAETEARLRAEQQRQITEQQQILDDIEKANRTKAAATVATTAGKGKGGRGGRGGGATQRPRRGHDAFVYTLKQPTYAPCQEEDTSCIICLDGARSYSSVPCGHLQFCDRCVAKLIDEDCKTCPACSTTLNPLQRFIKVFS